MTHTLVVLISGGGTNLQALIDAQESEIPGKIVQVISNRKGAYGLQRAKNAGISTAYHNLTGYKKKYPDDEKKARAVYDADLATIILETNPSLVVCAGWMHILAPTFLQPLDQVGIPVINLHPALPGEFNGINAIDRAYEAFQQGKITRTGVMIHYVIEAVDEGKPIVEKEVEIKAGDSLEDLENRIHATEWQAIVEGTRLALENLDTLRNPERSANQR